MPDFKDLLPSFPWEGPPLPRFLTRKNPPADTAPAETATPKSPVTIQYGNCEYGLECIKNHMLRAHLYMMESLRFSSAGSITPEAQLKVRQAREQLLCEDDFQSAMDASPAIKLQTLRLLAATRACWKAIEKSGIDMGAGTLDDLSTMAKSIQSLYNDAYRIDTQFRKERKVAAIES